MVFVELTPFQAFRRDNWTDEDLRGLQSVLIERPDAGPLIPGAGAQKASMGHARPGQAWRCPSHLLLADRGRCGLSGCAYAKNDQEDLTPDQARQLAS
jgi:hypothetical protein